MHRIPAGWRTLAASAWVAVLAFGGSATAHGGQARPIDSDYSNEVLASAPYKSGDGRIEIRRVREDDADGVAIVRTGSLREYRTRLAPAPANMPLADRVSAMYRDLTGQAITHAAYRALRDVEAQKRAVEATDGGPAASLGNASAGAVPRGGCTNIAADPDEFFFYNCYVYGPKKVEASGTDDVCLLVAAIHGNVGMQVSYKAINGNFYDNFHSDVSQGHYVAYQLRTSTKRTRKGQIYSASETDYSRFHYGGDYTLLGTNYPQLDECEDYAN